MKTIFIPRKRRCRRLLLCGSTSSGPPAGSHSRQLVASKDSKPGTASFFFLLLLIYCWSQQGSSGQKLPSRGSKFVGVLLLLPLSSRREDHTRVGSLAKHNKKSSTAWKFERGHLRISAGCSGHQSAAHESTAPPKQVNTLDSSPDDIPFGIDSRISPFRTSLFPICSTRRIRSIHQTE